ncbi:efflux RND transporter permease subunit [Erythrobacter sp. MTPC3]|uniref:efflux RND transporter permease subunit n=1 Tax=Erythrobacter sp. MTPC3 TaxID=3056564 RepID=UPI0036F31E02
MINLSEIGFRFRPAVLLTVVLAMIYGAISYFTLPAREDPQITIREAVVSTSQPGLAASRVEQLITTPLAEAIRTIPEVKEVRATSMEGQSIIHAEVEFSASDLDQVWDELADKVEETTPLLPEGARKPFINDEFGDVAVITMALQSGSFDMVELGDLAEHIRTRLYMIDGTREVDILGRPDERIYVEMDNATLAQLGAPLSAVARALRSQNTVAPGGTIETETRRIAIQPSGSFDSVEDIANLYLDLGAEIGSIRLGDYADIRRGFLEPPSQTAYFNGERAIVFAISMLDEESAINYAGRARTAINELQQALPAGVELNVMTWQADQVENAVYGVSFNVLQTLALVLGVVILFLGVRTGLIVGSIVPIVILVTLGVMGVFEIKLERMSLATIVISLGLLVDNGIVIAEDFKTRLAQGVDRRNAVGETGKELALPLLASTVTTILVFLPLMLAEEGSGEYTRSISLVILISLSSSWLIAMMVTPTLCYWFARPTDKETQGKIRRKVDQAFEWANDKYEDRLRWALDHRKLFMGAMGVAFFLAGYSLQFVPQQFFPASDRAQILVYADMPVGTSSAATDNQIQQIAQYIEDDERYPDFDNVAAYSGFGGPRFVLSLAPVDPAPNRGFMVINATDAKARDEGVLALREDLAAQFPGIRLRIAGMFLGPSDPNITQVQVRGPDRDVLLETGDKLAAILRDVDGTIDVTSDWENRSFQYRVAVDQAAARAAGVSSLDVSQALSGYFSGQPAGEFRDGDDLVPIILRAPERERSDPGRIQAVTLSGRDGPVQLGEIAAVTLRPQLGRIQTENLIETLTVEARPTEVTPQDLVPIVQEQLDELEASLPPGHFIEWDGIIAQSAEGTGALFASVPAMIGLIIIMLVALFRGFKRTGIILLTLPLSIIGAAIGLHVMRADFGFMVILGLFALVGIIINNAIVLVDRCDIEREQKNDVTDAVITASLRRFRPILMTNITTILGLLPLIIAQDVLFYGMASAIAFGLLVGTLLTLGVVPILYAWFFEGEEQAADDTNEKVTQPPGKGAEGGSGVQPGTA